MEIDVQMIEHLIDCFSRSEATQMDLKWEAFKLKLSKNSPQKTAAVTEQAVSAPAAPAVSQEAAKTGDPASAGELKTTETRDDSTDVLAPLAGIFYRASAPGEEPYVQVGQSVKKGDVIGLIEAMKIMNEVPAPCDGVVQEILLEDSEFAQYETVLMRIGGKQDV